MEEYEGGFLQSSPKHEVTGVKTLRDLTSKQINSYEPSEGSSNIVIIDNAEVTNIRMCGYVISKKSTSAGTLFEIFDTTGTQECAFWGNGSYDEYLAQRIVENSLISIIGSLKVFNNRKSVNVTNITIISSNHLIYHLTNCLYQHLFYNNMISREVFEQKKSGLSKIQNDILDVYRRNQDEEGLDIQVVMSMLKSKYSESDINNAIGQLLYDCHLYSVDGTNYRTSI